MLPSALLDLSQRDNHSIASSLTIGRNEQRKSDTLATGLELEAGKNTNSRDRESCRDEKNLSPLSTGNTTMIQYENLVSLLLNPPVFTSADLTTILLSGVTRDHCLIHVRELRSPRFIEEA